MGTKRIVIALAASRFVPSRLDESDSHTAEPSKLHRVAELLPSSGRAHFYEERELSARRVSQQLGSIRFEIAVEITFHDHKSSPALLTPVVGGFRRRRPPPPFRQLLSNCGHGEKSYNADADTSLRSG